MRDLMMRQIARQFDVLLGAAGMLVVSGLIVPTQSSAQSTAASPKFEVASVKLHKNPNPADVRFPNFSAARFTATVPLFLVIAEAYHLPINPSARLSGVPDWAKGPEGV